MGDSVWKILYDKLSEYRANVRYDDMYRDIEPVKPLRLSGGKSDEDSSLSPYLACKSILDDFDDIISAYKRAVGPCGKGECPFTGTLANLNCKKEQLKLNPQQDVIRLLSCTDLTCPFSMPYNKGLLQNNVDESVPLHYCGMTDCPFAQRNTVRNDNQVQAACGDPKCAFTKFKTGLIDDDCKEELAFLPKPQTGYCGKSKCQYPVMQPNLPPIHWECPEPLPKGACTNPNCPFLPADLRALQTIVRRGTCDSPSCTNVLPNERTKPKAIYCENTDCPYQNDCPSPNEDNQDDVKGTIIICENPKCPYQSISNPATDEYCGNPNCKFAPNKNSKLCEEEMPSMCSVPECPYNKLSQLLSGSKSNICSKLELELTENICNNPNCPMKQQISNNSCNNPSCPAKMVNQQENKAKSKCDNPSCPFADKSKKKVCYEDQKPKFRKPCENPDCPSKQINIKDDSCTAEKVCANPTCPFANKNIQDSSKEEEPQRVSCSEDFVCQNPKCPFALLKKCICEPGNFCSNPYCQFYGKTEDPCEDPRNLCSNPDCPHAPSNTCKEIANPCGLPTCPYSEPSAACADPCSDYKACDNPLCPYFGKVKRTVCDNPDCPYQNYTYEPEDSPEEEGEEDELVCKEPCSYAQVCGNEECHFHQHHKEINRIIERSKMKKQPQKTSDFKFKQKQWGGEKIHYQSKIPGYEGSMLGHRDCLTKVYHVPKNMGWLWNLSDPLNLRKRGFRPGAVSKKVANKIFEHNRLKALDKQKADPFIAEKKQTLTVTKKQGEYVLTVNPLKDPNSLRFRNESVYMDCTPIQFRIKKNKEPINYSSCICEDGEVAESTSSDSLELTFSPTGSRKVPALFESKKPQKQIDTQYDKKDIEAAMKGKKGKGKGGKGKGGKKGKGKGKKK